MSTTALSSLFQENNLVLFIILVLLFVVAYKILEAVIHAGIVAVLSGVFLIALDYVGIGPAVSISRFILFMVLGVALYLFYSSIETVLSIATTGFDAVKTTVKTSSSIGATIVDLLGNIYGRLKDLASSGDQKTDDNSTEKSIILEEVDEDDE